MDVSAFAVFYRQHYSLILTVAQQRLEGWSDAEDVTAQVFRLAWAHHLEGQELSLPWLYRVARNLIGNEYRRLARADGFARTIAPLVQELAAGPHSDDALDVRSAMLRLPEDARELLYMAYWEGLSRGEIAAILGCSAANVRLRLMRARRRVERLLAAPEAARPTEVDTSDE